MDEMNTSRSASAMSSPRDDGDNRSIFFNYEVSDADRADQGSTQSIEHVQEQGQRTGIRVSLACVPCRSRHVKCGAELPNCSRCLQDDKPCFYAKSRRGMRDRNTPNKRASLRDARKASPSSSSSNGPGVSINALASPYYGKSPAESYYGGVSDGSDTISISSSRRNPQHEPLNPRRLQDLYYTSFHKAHPFLLPRYYFLSRLQSDPASLQYLLPIVHYLGSLFLPDPTTLDLKAAAFRSIDNPNLPPNGFTVQALLLTAIALHGQDEVNRARAVLDRAIYVALDLRMNSRTFANMERDPVMAESWRRTYWFLYLTDSYLAAISGAKSFLLLTVDASVELPCEECDYDGIIPRPKTLAEYEARNFEEEEHIFSSFTYLVDLIRILGMIIGFDMVPGKEMETAINNADAMLLNWKLHLPKQKQNVIDQNEEVDEILFQAHNLLQILLISIHRPLSRLYHSPIEATAGISQASMQHPSKGEEDRVYWLHTKKALEAAEAAINLYALPIPMLHHSPLGIGCLSLTTRANLSACVYVHTGTDWYRTRDRVRLGLGGLKTMGQIWAWSKRTERETKEIARSVFSMGRPQDTGVIDSAFAFQLTQPLQQQAVGVEGGMAMAMDLGWQDLGQLDFLDPWDGMMLSSNFGHSGHA